MNIIVTGASQGIGYELVKKFSENEEARVLAISRNRQALEKLKKECKIATGNDIIIVSDDIADESFQYRFEEVAETFMPEVDILINNAGSLINKPFSELEAQDFDLMFSVNVKSVFLLVKVLLPRFNKPAHIVNIGSMGGYQGSLKFPGLSLYSASKGAVAILTECMAEELKDLEVRVNCLALGSAQTEMLKKAFPEFKAPLSAVEMADFISEFSLNGHKFFNGKILPVAVTTP